MRRTPPITFVQLMTESERALWRTEAHPDYYRVPVARLLDDGRQYHLWEASHARQMREVAHQHAPAQQAMELRKLAIKLIHRRGLVDYLRTYQITGPHREQLFHMFYGCTDYREAVITEHRQYIMSASSGLCAEVLVDAVNDANGFKLLQRYQQLYSQYFQIYSQYSRADFNGERELADALKPTMLEHRSYANLVRRRILVEAPVRARLRFTPVAPLERQPVYAMR